jgi:hypothetical protein
LILVPLEVDISMLHPIIWSGPFILQFETIC